MEADRELGADLDLGRGADDLAVRGDHGIAALEHRERAQGVERASGAGEAEAGRLAQLGGVLLEGEGGGGEAAAGEREAVAGVLVLEAGEEGGVAAAGEGEAVAGVLVLEAGEEGGEVFAVAVEAAAGVLGLEAGEECGEAAPGGEDDAAGDGLEAVGDAFAAALFVEESAMGGHAEASLEGAQEQLAGVAVGDDELGGVGGCGGAEVGDEVADGDVDLVADGGDDGDGAGDDGAGGAGRAAASGQGGYGDGPR